VEHTRVVLKLPRMLSDIVRELLESRTDVEVFAVLDMGAPLEAAVLDHAAELVIVAENEFHIPASWLELLEAHPGVRLLAVASAGHRGAVCEVLGNLPPDELVTLINARRRDTEPPVHGG
jgi:hypothetical protein